jgi:hypothetical protein
MVQDLRSHPRSASEDTLEFWLGPLSLTELRAPKVLHRRSLPPLVLLLTSATPQAWQGHPSKVRLEPAGIKRLLSSEFAHQARLRLEADEVLRSVCRCGGDDAYGDMAHTPADAGGGRFDDAFRRARSVGRRSKGMRSITGSAGCKLRMRDQ